MSQIVQVVSIAGEKSSGISYVVIRLCQLLRESGQDAVLVTLKTEDIEDQHAFCKSFSIGYGPKRLGRSRDMYEWLASQAESNEVSLIHSHGLWMMPNIYPSVVAKKFSLPLIVSPHGSLSVWAMAQGSSAKKLFWPLIQKPALNRAAVFHATCKDEYDDIRRLGFRQPVAIVPIGIDIPEIVQRPAHSRRTLLFLGRLHEKKGLPNLLKAWAVVEDRFPDWDLRVVGPDERGHLRRVQMLAEELRIRRCIFSGPLYGQDKWDAYASAELFILPSHSENFGIAIAEALAAGTPVIASKNTPWPELELRRAGWWVDRDVDALVACLKNALALAPEQLAEMGHNGREWMRAEYSWNAVGKTMQDVYRWMCGAGTAPKCIEMN